MSDRAARRARRDRWLARLGTVLLRILASTWRLRWVNADAVLAMHARGEAHVHLLWHGELLPLLWAYRKRGSVVLISEHGDGEIIARAGLALGFGTVRGSTTRGADRALLELTRVLVNGGCVAVTPDGPRGPRHSFAPGALIVAHRANAPLVPTRAFASRAWKLKSWDEFEIPKPFAKVLIVHGPTMRVEAATARDAAAQTGRFAELMERIVPPADG
ncbi:MAG TPA: lysophospholipid acyltransferase family protein [Gemmatimonadaceae bacterium]|nr:lysophospholipid acyltransferase family protein [Gemmatimonadaceae bacterium]